MAEFGMMIAGSFMSCVINRMADVVLGNYKLLTSKEKGVTMPLDAYLRQLWLFASDVEIQLLTHRDTDPNLKLWLYDLKKDLYKADDVLDSIEYKKLLHKQQQEGNSVTLPLKKLQSFIKIDDEIKELKALVATLDVKARKFSEQLKLDKKPNKETSGQKPPDIFEPIVGLEKEMDLVVNRLLPKRSDLSKMPKTAKSELNILCIAGFAGVGKFSLAQVVYHNINVGREFFRLWTYVPEISDARDVIKEILIQNSCELPKNNQTLNSLKTALHRILGRKKFLLVMYGVQKVVTKQWKTLKSVLRNGVEGNSIMLTTRQRTVADSLVPGESPIIVDFLDEDNCRRLFETYATGGAKPSRKDQKKLQEIGSSISQHLAGLPSAVKILGEKLKYNFDAECWNRILTGDWREHEELAKEVFPTLLSNYLHLPSHLQQCFAYCAIFPKNYIFEKEQLVQMWIAQGYIQSTPSKRMEVIGREWFDNLTDRFYFKGKGKGEFVMPDRVRDLAVYVSKDECFVADQISVRPPQTVRHLTITMNLPDIFKGLRYRNLKTMLIFCEFDQSIIKKVIEESKSLRVLVTHSRLPPQSLMKVNDGLLHLRYLGILSSKDNRLSGSISHLLHLQVLNLGKDNDKKLPQGMKKLINLRHLYSNMDTVSQISGIGNLTNLQELENFKVGSQNGYKIEELNGLNELSGSLCISKLNLVSSKEDALQANLEKKRHLETLQLRDDIKEEILEGLLPPPNLAKLEIFDYIGMEFPPNWMLACRSHFMNLQILDLKRHPSLTKLPPLGQIKKLKILILESLGIEKIGDDLYGDVDDAFPSLEELTLANLSKLTRWDSLSKDEGRGFLTVLSKLQIRDCKDLVSVPDLSPMLCLEELRIQKCDQLNSPFHKYISSLSSLRVIHISDCPQIESLGFPQQSAMEKLTLLQCAKLHSLFGFHHLNNLISLHISGCPRVNFSLMPRTYFPFLTMISANHIHFAKNVGRSLVQMMPSLKTLKLEKFQFQGITSDQDIWFEQLTSLQELNFTCCTKLESLPDKLSSCHSLRKLIINSCQNIKSLPEKGLPSSLQELHIKQCPILGQRCQKMEGDYWIKISRIPNIYIDGVTIQKL